MGGSKKKGNKAKPGKGNKDRKAKRTSNDPVPVGDKVIKNRVRTWEKLDEEENAYSDWASECETLVGSQVEPAASMLEPIKDKLEGEGGQVKPCGLCKMYHKGKCQKEVPWKVVEGKKPSFSQIVKRNPGKKGYDPHSATRHDLSNGNSSSQELGEVRDEEPKARPNRHTQVFEIETGVCTLEGDIIECPRVEGKLPMAKGVMGLTSGKVSWDVVLNINAPDSYVTQTVLDVEGKMLGRKLEIKKTQIKGKPPQKSVDLNLILPDESAIVNVPFYVINGDGPSFEGKRFSVILGRTHLRLWRTRIEKGEHPSYMDHAKIYVSSMLGRRQTMMHNNYVSPNERCLQCNLFHAKPIGDCVDTGKGAERDCSGDFKAEQKIYRKQFYTFSEFPCRNRCPYCRCNMSGACGPNEVWRSLEYRGAAASNGEEGTRSEGTNQ